ncbi:MAG: GyrI-like domain-containing protein [Methanoregula sp.]
MMEIVLVEVPAMNVLGTRKTGTYALIPELIRKVFAYIQKKGVAGLPNFLCHETHRPQSRRQKRTVLQWSKLHGGSMN